MFMSRQKKNFQVLLLVGLFLIPLLVFSRPFSLVFIFLLILVSIAAGMMHLYTKYMERKAEMEKANTVYGVIEGRLEQCNDEIEKHSKEVKEIRINIRDLEFRLKQAVEVKEETRQETLEVIQGFKKELALRETKISFYNTCKRKLTTLLYNYNLSQELKKKKAKLSKLQEDNFESVAEMESMKSDMAYDFSFVETISDLSSRMLKSNNLDNAKELQLQLVEITSEIKDMR